MKLEEIQIRETSVNDFADIMEVEKTAFGYDKEAELVADLLKDPSAEPRLSLLARYNGKAVGHILFTKVEIEGAAIQPLIHILAPLAVIPDFQKQGIGGLLIRKGIQMLKKKIPNLSLYWDTRNIIPDMVSYKTPKVWVIPHHTHTRHPQNMPNIG